MNKGFIERNLKLHRSIPDTETDPLENFRKITNGKQCNFRLQPINAQQLDLVVTKIKPSNSSANDQISAKTLKKLYRVLKYPILNMINISLETQTYPQILKQSKIIPLLKKGKSPNEIKSFRAINILPSLGKLLDKIVSNQIIQYLVEQDLIPHEHHGGINSNNTITAISTMVDNWATSLEANQDLAIIILDQTAAYDLISHKILLQKMKILGFDDHTSDYFKNYLENRSQRTVVDGTLSEELFSGPISVIQGSVLSCLLFLLYTLDLPYLFLQAKVTIENYEDDDNPKPTTFVDDVVTTIKIEDDLKSQRKLDTIMDTFETYMSSNKLLLNREKTQLLIISNKTEIRKKMFLTAQPKNVLPLRGFTYLGIDIADTLKWNFFIEDSKNNLIAALKNAPHGSQNPEKILQLTTNEKICQWHFSF